MLEAIRKSFVASGINVRRPLPRDRHHHRDARNARSRSESRATDRTRRPACRGGSGTALKASAISPSPAAASFGGGRPLQRLPGKLARGTLLRGIFAILHPMNWRETHPQRPADSAWKTAGRDTVATVPGFLRQGAHLYVLRPKGLTQASPRQRLGFQMDTTKSPERAAESARS
jgi:hypothetical protein